MPNNITRTKQHSTLPRLITRTKVIEIKEPKHVFICKTSCGLDRLVNVGRD